MSELKVGDHAVDESMNWPHIVHVLTAKDTPAGRKLIVRACPREGIPKPYTAENRPEPYEVAEFLCRLPASPEMFKDCDGTQ